MEAQSTAFSPGWLPRPTPHDGELLFNGSIVLAIGA
jgi:hypothetical protein